MSNSDNDKEAIEKAINTVVDAVDIDALRAGPVPKDPILNILYINAVEKDMDLREAFEHLVETLMNYSQAIIDNLNFPPKAVMGFELGKRLEALGLEVKDPEMSAAITYLYRQGVLYAENGWYAKLTPPIPLTQDDFDWLTGTGRFAQ